MLASTFPCVITTPLGSAVVPEVKTICRVSSRPTTTFEGSRVPRPGPCLLCRARAGISICSSTTTGATPAAPNPPRVVANKPKASPQPAPQPAPQNPPTPHHPSEQQPPRTPCIQRTPQPTPRSSRPKASPARPCRSPAPPVAGQTERHLQNLPVGEPLHPVSATLPVGTLISVRLKVRQEKLC